MNRIHAMLLCVLALGLCSPGPAAAASEGQPSTAPDGKKPKNSKEAKAGKQKKTAAPKLTAPGGSSETPAERSARLKRECKGRPNAGACSGYTD